MVSDNEQHLLLVWRERDDFAPRRDLHVPGKRLTAHGGGVSLGGDHRQVERVTPTPESPHLSGYQVDVLECQR